MKPNELERLEKTISTIMRVGVALSATTLIAGLVLAAISHPAAGVALKAGLVFLMMIPAVRILVSLGDALLRRDGLLAGATALVAAVLLWQFFNPL